MLYNERQSVYKDSEMNTRITTQTKDFHIILGLGILNNEVYSFGLFNFTLAVF